MRVLAALFLSAFVLPCLAQQGGDLQARILYAYQTEDLNGLRDLMQTLGAQVAAGAASPALRYHLAHADYRYAELDARAADGSAEAAATDCVDQLDAVLKRAPRSAEALALQSACYRELAGFRRFARPYLRIRAQRSLDAAYRLDPHNPRVLYLLAKSALATAKPGSPDAAQALARLREAAEAFERSPATRVDVPGWGHAEAYLALGHCLRLEGDPLGARNWIERALIAAPDYKAAQRERRDLEGR